MSFQQQEWYRKPVDITNRMFYSKNHPIAKRKQTCVWLLYVSNITEKSSDKIHKINYPQKGIPWYTGNDNFKNNIPTQATELNEVCNDVIN